jgi:DNA polymerase (family 10)
VQNLLRIPGVGPKTARRLNEELGLIDAADVVVAARQGKIRQLYGFGPKREQLLLEGAEAVLNGFEKVSMPLPPEDDELEELRPRLQLLPSAIPLPEAA